MKRIYRRNLVILCAAVALFCSGTLQVNATVIRAKVIFMKAEFCWLCFLFRFCVFYCLMGSVKVHKSWISARTVWRTLSHFFAFSVKTHSVFFIIKPTRCTNFQNLLRHETIHVSGSSSAHHQEFIHCTLGTGICHTGFKTAFGQDQDKHPGPARKLSSNLYDICQRRVYNE